MVAMVAIDGRTRIASSRRPTRGSGVVHRAWNLRVLGRLPHGPRPCCPSGRPGTPRRRPDVSLRHLGSTFRPVATMATMATPRGQPLKKKSHGYPLVGYHPLHPSLAFFFKVQFRGGHGGHGGHDTRTAPRDPESRGQCARTPRAGAAVRATRPARVGRGLSDTGGEQPRLAATSHGRTPLSYRGTPRRRPDVSLRHPGSTFGHGHT